MLPHDFPRRGASRASTSSDHGWALAEALVATVVLAAGASLVASLFAQTMSSVRASRDHSAASRLASQKLEELISDPALPVASPNGSLLADIPGFFDRLDERGRPASDGIYLRRWLVEPVGLAAPSPSRVLVVVRLRSQPGEGRTLAAVRWR